MPEILDAESGAEPDAAAARQGKRAAAGMDLTAAERAEPAAQRI